MRELALRHGTVINTVIFGAMAGSGALPLSREACEEAIRRSGKAVDASLRGFAAGFERSMSGTAGATEPETRSPKQVTSSTRVLALPEAVREIVAAGVSQTSDYQNHAYAALYLDRVEAINAVELSLGGSSFDVTREAARYLALWMSYEDVIRVADLKTRRDRLDRVRKEVGARDGEPLKLTEYLKPGLDEICSLLPTRMAQWLRRGLAHKAHKLNVGLHMRTDTIIGFALLCGLRSLRPLRPRTSRYATEQTMIERWLGAIRLALPRSLDLAHELALCGNLVKGYGETSQRGHRNLASILDDARHQMALDLAVFTQRVRGARLAALADPEGRQLAGALGLPAPEPKTHPIRIVRRQPVS
jgi:indolepyruvate ferredoxin oxidoreductase beta subunit